jgi:hypothetical protein
MVPRQRLWFYSTDCGMSAYPQKADIGRVAAHADWNLLPRWCVTNLEPHDPPRRLIEVKFVRVQNSTANTFIP